ncbi:MAG: toprim domain-containing protein [Candidatus Saliniplasma sp.]
MRIKEKLEGTERVLETIREKNREIPIIVEGKKDVNALRRLGIKGRIIKIKTSKTVFRIIEGLRKEHDEVIILTDWDRTGARLYHRVKKACKANTLSFDQNIRKRLIKYTRKDIKDVESLPAFLSRLRRIVKDPYEARNKR